MNGKRSNNMRLDPIMERCGLDPDEDYMLLYHDDSLLFWAVVGLLVAVVQLEICWFYSDRITTDGMRTVRR